MKARSLYCKHDAVCFKCRELIPAGEQHVLVTSREQDAELQRVIVEQRRYHTYCYRAAKDKTK